MFLLLGTSQKGSNSASRRLQNHFVYEVILKLSLKPLWRLSWGFSGSSFWAPRGSPEALGGSLGASWGLFGAVFGRTWLNFVLVGLIWGPLGSFWASPGPQNCPRGELIGPPMGLQRPHGVFKGRYVLLVGLHGCWTELQANFGSQALRL